MWWLDTLSCPPPPVGVPVVAAMVPPRPPPFPSQRQSWQLHRQVARRWRPCDSPSPWVCARSTGGIVQYFVISPAVCSGRWCLATYARLFLTVFMPWRILVFEPPTPSSPPDLYERGFLLMPPGGVRTAPKNRLMAPHPPPSKESAA